MDTVDRTYEHAYPDNEVKVTLHDGFTVEFFVAGLTDDLYIYRAKEIQRLEKEQ